MSILEAYCNKCANKAGRNRHECNRCEELPHVKAIKGSGKPCNEYGAKDYLVVCPYCKKKERVILGNLEYCVKFKEEYVSEEVDRFA